MFVCTTGYRFMLSCALSDGMQQLVYTAEASNFCGQLMELQVFSAGGQWSCRSAAASSVRAVSSQVWSARHVCTEGVMTTTFQSLT